MIFLKDGWYYTAGSRRVKNKEKNPMGIGGRYCFSNAALPIFTCEFKAGIAAEVAPENVKIELIGFPSELIYALFSTITGLSFGGVPVPAPLHFLGAYTHIPTDWTSKVNQLILVYLLLWNIREEKAHNYTKGKIGFKEEDK